MKAVSPSGSKKTTTRRVSKPVMEKRRRERINHSLESLRLLMLDNTKNEKMKNPKVEKAEILESVVRFLKKEKDSRKGHRDLKKTCEPQTSYHDGMRSCLLRFSHFIASRSPESERASNGVQASYVLPGPQENPPGPSSIHMALMPAAGGESAALAPQLLPHHHLYPTHSGGLVRDSRGLLSPAAPPTHITDAVWRPWPQ